ncbi:mRNA export protein mlo3 [Phakopsora pachyrhizi]|uniref:mRNA export protein mlo3 n=1 Tax=Phakopsora pachyrhizi TaxID=170000 RepID=A0AAV0B2D6_PHAPC|nr:mRNA export protein mlo3 [Phakopsora pachyrhizi]
MGQGSKIIVSNLPSDVAKNQIWELFSTTVGPVNRVALSYDNRGVSKGTAQVKFKQMDDSKKAFQQYNKACNLSLWDGKVQMFRISIIQELHLQPLAGNQTAYASKHQKVEMVDPSADVTFSILLVLSCFSKSFDRCCYSKCLCIILLPKRATSDRPMKVEIVVDPATIPPPPLSNRVAPAPKAANPASAGANGQAANRGSPQGGNLGKGRGNRQPQKTAANLDAKMEDYQKAK